MLGFLALSLLTVAFANAGIVSRKKGLILPLVFLVISATLRTHENTLQISLERNYGH